jgi:acyl-CoA thioesterase I
MFRFFGRRHFIACLALLAAGGLSAASARADAPSRILIVGDSMSAEYGLTRGSGWVALLEQRLRRERISGAVINASISGDTTAGGRSRLPALLKQHQPTHVVIELGGNDALRGLPLESTQRNLSEMVKASQEAGARVLLVGIQVPPNYGRAYTERFAATFEAVAAERKVPLVPFLLKGVADVPDAAKFFQPDRIHPNESAQPLLLDNVWPALRRLLTP